MPFASCCHRVRAAPEWLTKRYTSARSLVRGVSESGRDGGDDINPVTYRREWDQSRGRHSCTMPAVC